MRNATPSDVPAIMAALFQMREKSPAPQVRLAEPIEAELSVRHAIHEGRAYFLGGYFVMYDISRTWYSSKKVLIEDLILKVHEDSSVRLRDVIRSLSDLALMHGCKAVVAGDTQIGYMTPRYIQEGFQVLGTQLYKELHHGIHA